MKLSMWNIETIIKSQQLNLLVVICICAIITVCGHPAIAEETIASDVKDLARESIETRQATQHEKDAWQIEKAKLEATLISLRKENRQLTQQRTKLVKEVTYFESRNKELLWEIEQALLITSQIPPFLETLYLRLKALIEYDSPFLEAERFDRLSRLRYLLDNPEASIGEKYRRTLEALMVELDYGNTIEVYQDKIKLDNQDINVNIFRLGRVSLFFQTTDKETTGRYNPASAEWVTFPLKYNRDINIAFEIAAKRHPIEILNLPLGKTTPK